MTRFEKWFINRVFRREVRQGYDHPRRITALYRMINEAAENEFYEDNRPTLNSNLSEWFQNSLKGR